ncbi:MAG: hypothetical protein AABY22_24770 [Nanoarchaeota archaeon]
MVFPEDHTQDYDLAIRKVELSVWENIALQENEFNNYVMNNWSWKNTFLNVAQIYTNAITGAYYYSGLMPQAVLTSGCEIVFNR